MEEVDPRAARRAQRRAAQREAGRTEILDAAERVLGRDGVTGASLRSIADEAGFSPAAIYLFFKNREELVFETLSRRGVELISEMGRVADGPGGALERLHAIVDTAVAFFAARPHFRLLLRHSRGGLTITGSTLSAYGSDRDPGFARSMELLAAVVAQGQAAGQIRPGDPQVLAQFYTVLVNEYVLMLEPSVAPREHRFSAEEFHNLLDAALRDASALA